MIRQLARELAQTPHSAPNDPLPPELKDLSYDVYRTVRFRPEQALWGATDLPFQVQFFHRGFLFTPRVNVYEVDQGRARPIRYTARQAIGNILATGQARSSV